MKIPSPSGPGQRPSDSEVVMTELVLPSHTNAIGTIFGGTVVSWIDIAAAISAMRHARKQVVTASIDALSFVSPIKLGNVVEIHARVNFVSRTSMEIGVRVDTQNAQTGEKHHAVTAYTTFVALDEHGRPTPVPPLVLETPEDKRRFEEARQRRESRMALAKAFDKKR